jgi:ubiquinone/menaquinone biosynthesis C-methylase UbiE
MEWKEKDGANLWTDEDFNSLGKSDFGDFIACWNTFGYDHDHCVEIGCGSGRLTMYLAETFDLITALDVCEEQIEYARDHIHRSNVRYCKVNGVDIPLENECGTAVFSMLVFPHSDGPSLFSVNSAN